MYKTAFITGASRGIGKEIALTLAAAGYQLYLNCHRSEQELICLKQEIEHSYNVPCTIFLADIADSQKVTSMFQNIPQLDVLINNAGVSHIGLLSDMTDEEWHRVISTNLDSVFYTCRCAIPLMLSQKSGHILNISSVWGIGGASMEVAYSASKGGMNSFTKALAKELAPSHIQVNAIACGFIDTDMNKNLEKEVVSSIINDIPADRIGRAEEAAQFVVQLLRSPEYLTGQVIALDGGWL